MYAKSDPDAGVPATAEAVSWDPTATTSVGYGTPASGRTGPMWVPGSRSLGNRSARMPASAISSAAQVRRRAS
jgi:hypothetical protein